MGVSGGTHVADAPGAGRGLPPAPQCRGQAKDASGTFSQAGWLRTVSAPGPWSASSWAGWCAAGQRRPDAGRVRALGAL